MAARRLAHTVVRLGIVLAVCALIAEAGARFILFAEAADGTGIARKLRSPSRLAYTTADDDYWLLRTRFTPPDERKPPAGFDPVFGWTGYREIRSGDFARSQRELLAGRRPVLLYGDSFAQGRAGKRGGFRGALESTELGTDYLLVNYGVGGYGLDQVHLLLTSTIDEWVDLDPVVMIGILVDDDLDRCLLSFRDWPKPRLALRHGELTLEQPVLPSVAEALEAVPRATTSYALRLLLRGRSRTASRDARLRAHTDLCESLLVETVELLRDRELEHFFVLFFGPRSVQRADSADWREAWTVDRLRAIGAPWVSTRHAILQHETRTGRPATELYEETNHLNATGNRVAFRAMADGLAGLFDLEETRGLPSVAMIEQTVLRGERAIARFEYGLQAPFTDPIHRVRLSLRVGRDGPTELSYRLEGRVRAFRARASLFPLARTTRGSVGLTILADGEPVFQRTIRRADGESLVAVDLTGRQRMTVRADDAGDGIRGDCLVLAAPVFTAEP